MAELFSLDTEKTNTLQILCYDLVCHVECPAITVKPFPPTMPLSRQVQRKRSGLIVTFILESFFASC
ncbi:hypothetical protein BDV39DRAFT_181570 [Aspergillus sergii]|uniref:Uncharacterized protein n=1 Tax=Aspergillus sergii TaxID=1034303 RepID=A0A5N6WV98_9EURO|nr:hypothetical protein BDV39DRAFT_181570 [Aspergillus sergii]